MLKLATKFAPHDLMLAMARDAGYRYAEIWTDAGVLADWRAVAERCKRYPLSYAVHFPNRRPSDEQALADAVSLCRALGVPALVIHQPQFDQLSGRLLELDAALPLAVENHVLSPVEFEAWAQENPGLTLDVEHLWQFTLKDCPLAELLAAVASFLERHAPKLRHVHLPGYLPGQGNHRPMHNSPDMVRAVFSLLAQHDYRGLIVSEIANEHQTPPVLAADRAFFQAWAETDARTRPTP